jgi:uncharacterized protein
MSAANVEVVRRAIEAFSRGDLDAAAAEAVYAPDVEFHEDPKLLEPGVYRGREEIEAYFRQFLDSFEEYRFEIEELLDAGDRVVVFNRQWARGKGSGAEVEMRNAWVFTLRDGRIVRVQPYWDRSAAMEAAGLPEE